jgi:hypothetical protein
MQMGTYPDFDLRIMGVLRQVMSVYIKQGYGKNQPWWSRARDCQGLGLAKFNHSVLAARGRAISYAQRQAGKVPLCSYTVKTISFSWFPAQVGPQVINPGLKKGGGCALSCQYTPFR